MILVVNKADNKILGRYEAWDMNATEQAMADIKKMGKRVISDEITMMGDMIIWVA